MITDLYANMQPEEYQNAGWLILDSSELNLQIRDTPKSVLTLLQEERIVPIYPHPARSSPPSPDVGRG